MKKLTAVLIIMVFMAAPMALAGFEKSSWAENDGSYTENALAKLEFGVLNVLGSWTEIYYVTEGADNKVMGFLEGLTKGVVNTALGAVHLVTFPIPVDVPLMEGGLQVE